MKLRALVIDDEAPARRRMIRLLEQVPELEVVGDASEAESAAALVEQLHPDVVFLDVRMPREDGLSLASRLGPRTAIVFVTAHAEHAARAFDIDSSDYLLKPVQLARLEEAVRRVRTRRAASAPVPLRVVAHERGETVLVDARTVSRFRAVDKYTAFLFEGRELLTEESLVSLETRLATAGFVRVHRAELIRLDAVRSFRHADGAHAVLLDDGQEVPVSRRLSSSLRDKLDR